MSSVLGDAKMIGFLLTTDYARSREFFEAKLECKFVSQDQFALVMSVGGHQIRIVRVPAFNALPSTVLGWEVPAIADTVEQLRRRGVIFEQYPFIQDKNLGIWSAPGGARVAWFKDPDGNVLSLSQHPPV